MSKNKKSSGREAYAANYKTSKTWEKNRRRKLLRAQKAQPNNDQIRLALLDINYRRKTPKAPFWSHSMINTAKLFKEFAGSVDILMFSADEKKRALGLQSRGIYSQLPEGKKKREGFQKAGMFSIEARLVNGREGLSWSS